MSPELLNRFEPVAREQHEQVVTNRASQLLSISLKSRATRWLSMNLLFSAAAGWSNFGDSIQQLTSSMRQMQSLALRNTAKKPLVPAGQSVPIVPVVPIVSKPHGSSKFNVQEFKVLLRPVPTVPAVSNVPLVHQTFQSVRITSRSEPCAGSYESTARGS